MATTPIKCLLALFLNDFETYWVDDSQTVNHVSVHETSSYLVSFNYQFAHQFLQSMENFSLVPITTMRERKQLLLVHTWSKTVLVECSSPINAGTETQPCLVSSFNSMNNNVGFWWIFVIMRHSVNGFLPPHLISTPQFWVPQVFWVLTPLAKDEIFDA